MTRPLTAPLPRAAPFSSPVGCAGGPIMRVSPGGARHSGSQGRGRFLAVRSHGGGHRARSTANGVCHSNVRITPNAGIPAEKRPPRNWRSFPPPAFGGLCRPGGRPSSPGGGSRAALTACGKTHAAFDGRCIPAEPPRFAGLCVAFRSKYTRYSSLTRLVSRAPRPSRRSRGFHHRLLTTCTVGVPRLSLFMPGGVCRRTDHGGFSRWGLQAVPAVVLRRVEPFLRR